MSRATWTRRESVFYSTWLPGLGFGEQGDKEAVRNKTRQGKPSLRHRDRQRFVIPINLEDI